MAGRRFFSGDKKRLVFRKYVPGFSPKKNPAKAGFLIDQASLKLVGKL